MSSLSSAPARQVSWSRTLGGGRCRARRSVFFQGDAGSWRLRFVQDVDLRALLPSSVGLFQHAKFCILYRTPELNCFVVGLLFAFGYASLLVCVCVCVSFHAHTHATSTRGRFSPPSWVGDQHVLAAGLAGSVWSLSERAALAPSVCSAERTGISARHSQVDAPAFKGMGRQLTRLECLGAWRVVATLHARRRSVLVERFSRR